MTAVVVGGLAEQGLYQAVSNTSLGRTAVNDVTSGLDDAGNAVSNFFKITRLPPTWKCTLIKSDTNKNIDTLKLNDLFEKYIGKPSKATFKNSTGGNFTIIDSNGTGTTLAEGESKLFDIEAEKFTAIV